MQFAIWTLLSILTLARCQRDISHIGGKNCEGPNESPMRYAINERTCDNPWETIEKSTVCACEHDYFRNKDGVCVKFDDCPKLVCPTDANATITEFGDSCPVTCANRFENRWGCQNVGIEFGCKCNDGFVKDQYVEGVFVGKCIAVEDCPKVCPNDPNAYVTECGDPCPVTCVNRYDKDKECKAKCIPGGCKCNVGFVKDTYVKGKIQGKCIPVSQCPQMICPTDRNAKMMPCGEHCSPTCSGGIYCPGCEKGACVCFGNYLKDFSNPKLPEGRCIREGNCPEQPPTTTQAPPPDDLN